MQTIDSGEDLRPEAPPILAGARPPPDAPVVYGRTTVRLAVALALCAASLASILPRRAPPRRASRCATRSSPRVNADRARRLRGSAPTPRRCARWCARAAAPLRLRRERIPHLLRRYRAAEVESVAAVLRSLDHGPEIARLSVFVATPEQIREACGAEVLACYFPSVDEMVVSGEVRPVDGVPRDFAIAHEYGHHVANTRAGAALPAIEAGTSRWATYERVCQLTRRGRLFPGNQGAHYWQNPEEAFAQSYARLNRPGDSVSWQYTSLLRPSAASLAKIHADVANPVGGPVDSSWRGSLAGPPATPASATGVSAGPLGVGAGRVVGAPPWIASRSIRTPLDGPVSISLQAPEGAGLVATLRDAAADRVLAPRRHRPARRRRSHLLQLRPRRPAARSPRHLRPGRLRGDDRKALNRLGPASAPVDVELSSRVDSMRGGIRSTFTGIPDGPVSRFILDMQGGKKGLLVNSRNLCRKPKRNKAISNIRGQNGRFSKTKPRVVATTCQKQRKAKRKKANRSPARVARASTVR